MLRLIFWLNRYWHDVRDRHNAVTVTRQRSWYALED